MYTLQSLSSCLTLTSSGRNSKSRSGSAPTQIAFLRSPLQIVQSQCPCLILWDRTTTCPPHSGMLVVATAFLHHWTPHLRSVNAISLHCYPPDAILVTQCLGLTSHISSDVTTRRQLHASTVHRHHTSRRQIGSGRIIASQNSASLRCITVHLVTSHATPLLGVVPDHLSPAISRRRNIGPSYRRGLSSL